MAAATIEQTITTGCPVLEVVRLEASDQETFQSERFRLIKGALVCMNEDSDVAVNVEDDDSSAIDGSQDGVIVNVNGKTDVTVSLLLVGRRS